MLDCDAPGQSVLKLQASDWVVGFEEIMLKKFLREVCLLLSGLTDDYSLLRRIKFSRSSCTCVRLRIEKSFGRLVSMQLISYRGLDRTVNHSMEADKCNLFFDCFSVQFIQIIQNNNSSRVESDMVVFFRVLSNGVVFQLLGFIAKCATTDPRQIL